MINKIKSISLLTWFFVFVATLCLAGFITTIYSQPNKQPRPVADGKVTLPIPSSFTLEDKIGQLLIVGVSDANTAKVLEQKYQIGGFLVGSESNLTTKQAISSIKGVGKIPPLFATDEEGGEVDRINESKYLSDSAKYMGTLPDAQVETIATEMGRDLVKVGINVDLAPVVDLDDGANSVISALQRSFSNSPLVVTKKAQAFASGLRRVGIVPTFKHFPGLGYAMGITDGNTDTGTATTPPLTELEQNDLIPYQTLLNNNLTGIVMMGNQVVPGLTNGLPASLSSPAYSLLRSKYGFKQVVITDDLLNARSVINTGETPSQRVISAIEAGATMPLIEASSEREVATIIVSIQQAVKDGRLQVNQINMSLKKILQLKSSLNK